MMAELTRSRNPSENSDEKDFLAKLKRCDSSEDKANLKIKAKPLKSGNGLQIFLTREDDPGFYYSVDITDEDYRELRIRQGLLVELSAFPPMIFRLLDTCIAEEHTETPKFFPILEFSDARGDEVNFEIQEINLYRKLAHLSLKLRKGNDAKVREHLADCLKNLKLQHNSTLKTLEETSDTLKEIQEEKTRALTDLDKQKRDFCERDSLYKSRLSQEINEERERAAKHVAEMRLSYDAERRRLVEDHAATLRTLENRVAALDYDNRDLAEKKHKHEALIQRLKEESKNMTEENKRLRSEVSS